MDFPVTLQQNYKVQVQILGVDSGGKTGALLQDVVVTFNDPIGVITQEPGMFTFLATGVVGSAVATVTAKNELGEDLEAATLSITVIETPAGKAVSITLVVGEPTVIV